jgi:hypothetical protein
LSIEEQQRQGYNKRGVDWAFPGRTARLRDLFLDGYRAFEVASILSREWGLEVTQPAVENAKYDYVGSLQRLELDDSTRLYKETTLPDGDYIISCDYHAPYVSEAWVNRLVAIAQKFDIRRHVIAGDLWDQNYAKFHDVIDGEETPDLDTERDQCDPLMQVLAWFDETFLITGNHETRLSRLTAAKVQTRQIVELFGKPLGDKLKFSEYDKVNIGTDWLVVHPKSYSQVSGSTAVRLAEKYHRHVLNAHGHFSAKRWDRSGEYMGVDLGGLFDTRKVAYQALQSTTHPVWNNAFSMLRHGHCQVFDKDTDWHYWLGEA